MTEDIKSSQESIVKTIHKIRSQTLRRFLFTYQASKSVEAILDEKFGGIGLEYKGCRPTTETLGKLMREGGWKTVSERTVRDYAYAIEALEQFFSL